MAFTQAQIVRLSQEQGIPTDPRELAEYARARGLNVDAREISYAGFIRWPIIRELVLRNLEEQGVDVGSTAQQREEREDQIARASFGEVGRSRGSLYREANSQFTTSGRVGVDTRPLTLEELMARRSEQKRQQRERDEELRQAEGRRVIEEEKKMLEAGYNVRNYRETPEGYELEFSRVEYARPEKPIEPFALNYSPNIPNVGYGGPTKRDIGYKGKEAPTFSRALTPYEKAEREFIEIEMQRLNDKNEFGSAYPQEVRLREIEQYLEREEKNAFSIYGPVVGTAVQSGRGAAEGFFGNIRFSREVIADPGYALGSLAISMVELPKTAYEDFTSGRGAYFIGTLLGSELGIRGFTRKAGYNLGKAGIFTVEAVKKAPAVAYELGKSAFSKGEFLIERVDFFGGKPIYGDVARPTVRISKSKSLLVGQTLISSISPPKGVDPRPSRPRLYQMVQEARELEKVKERMDQRFPDMRPQRGLTSVPSRGVEPFDFAALSAFALSEVPIQPVKGIPAKRTVLGDYQPPKQKAYKRVGDFSPGIYFDLEAKGGFFEVKGQKKDPSLPSRAERETLSEPAPVDDFTLSRAFLRGSEKQAPFTSKAGLEFYELDYLNERPIGYTKNIFARNPKAVKYGTLLGIGAGLSIFNPAAGKAVSFTAIAGLLEQDLVTEFAKFKPKKKPRVGRIKDDAYDFYDYTDRGPVISPSRGRIYDDSFRNMVDDMRKVEFKTPDLGKDISRLPKYSFATRNKDKRKEDSFPLSAFRLDTRSKSRNLTDQFRKTNVLSDSATKQKTDTIQKQRNIFRVQRPSEPARDPPFRDRDIPDISRPPRPRDPETPFPPIRYREDLNDFGLRKIKKTRTKRGYQYAPSVTAELLGIRARGKAPKSSTVFTGAEIRPIFGNNKRRRWF